MKSPSVEGSGWDSNICSNPKISVLMPVYNAEKYIKQAIESILKQTYTNFDLIICYDESSDRSLKIIDEFKTKDARILISYGKRRGLVGALNDGIKLSRGQYIARMDADDISVASRLEEQVRFMDANPNIGVCGTWIETFGEVKKRYVSFFPSSDNALKVRLLFSVPFAHPSVMIRKKVILYKDTSEDFKSWYKNQVETMTDEQKKYKL